MPRAAAPPTVALFFPFSDVRPTLVVSAGHGYGLHSRQKLRFVIAGREEIPHDQPPWLQEAPAKRQFLPFYVGLRGRLEQAHHLCKENFEQFARNRLVFTKVFDQEVLSRFFEIIE